MYSQFHGITKHLMYEIFIIINYADLTKLHAYKMSRCEGRGFPGDPITQSPQILSFREYTCTHSRKKGKHALQIEETRFKTEKFLKLRMKKP